MLEEVGRRGIAHLLFIVQGPLSPQCVDDGSPEANAARGESMLGRAEDAKEVLLVECPREGNVLRHQMPLLPPVSDVEVIGILEIEQRNMLSPSGLLPSAAGSPCLSGSAILGAS